MSLQLLEQRRVLVQAHERLAEAGGQHENAWAAGALHLHELAQLFTDHAQPRGEGEEATVRAQKGRAPAPVPPGLRSTTRCPRWFRGYRCHSPTRAGYLQTPEGRSPHSSCSRPQSEQNHVRVTQSTCGFPATTPPPTPHHERPPQRGTFLWKSVNVSGLLSARTGPCYLEPQDSKTCQEMRPNYHQLNHGADPPGALVPEGGCMMQHDKVTHTSSGFKLPEAFSHHHFI